MSEKSCKTCGHSYIDKNGDVRCDIRGCASSELDMYNGWMPKTNTEEEYKEDKKLKWIPIKVRPLDKEEREYYGEDYCFIWDCKLPDDGEEVLVTTASGHVDIDTFYDGYFENYSNHDDLLAWTPLPLPWKGESEDKE